MLPSFLLLAPPKFISPTSLSFFSPSPSPSPPPPLLLHPILESSDLSASIESPSFPPPPGDRRVRPPGRTRPASLYYYTTHPAGPLLRLSPARARWRISGRHDSASQSDGQSSETHGGEKKSLRLFKTNKPAHAALFTFVVDVIYSLIRRINTSDLLLLSVDFDIKV